jgi:sodium-dependent dicarboxylate transporter 2/3/5
MKFSAEIKGLGLIAALITFFFILFLPLPIETSAQNFLAIFSMVIVLWLLTDLPLFVSGLIGVTLSIIMGVSTVTEAFVPFVDPIIFLFLGGFLLARAFELTELDQILVHKMLSYPWVQHSPQRMVLVFLGMSVFFSMWISNTAAMAMLLPISLGLLKKLKLDYKIEGPEFREKFILAVAYCTTVGGHMTPIGSPPNVIAIGMLKKLANQDLSFGQWMLYTIPFGLIVFYFIYQKCLKAMGVHRSNYGGELKKLEMLKSEDVFSHRTFLNPPQKWLLVIFAGAIICWILPSLVLLFIPSNTELTHFLKEKMTAPVVSIVFALMLFLFPLNRTKKLLELKQILKIDWPSLLLFGSGLSLGGLLFKTKLVTMIVESIGLFQNHLNIAVILILFLLVTIVFTELASNTATANILLPLMIAFAQQNQISSVSLVVIFALACNSGFMLPVGTPPNAIAYGTGMVHKGRMAKWGFELNLISVLLLAMAVLFLFIT